MGVTAKLTDVGEGGGKPSALGNSHLEPKHTIPEETKASYASVAAKSSKGDDNFRGGPSLDLEDVEELCGGSIESKDQPVAMELNPRGATGTEILPEDLYGPWMMVQSRRRGNVRQANVNQEKNESEKQKNLDEQSVEQATIKDASTSTGAQKKVSLKDAAYLASNPERKTKKNNLGNIIPLAADVVPLVSREEMEVIPHVIKQGNSKHKAITIVEPGFPANDTGNKRTGSWAHRMSDQLDEIGKSGQTGDVGIDGESNQDAQMGSPSDDDDHRSSDSIVDLDDEVTWTSSEYFAEQNGQNIAFWHDRWLPNVDPLISYVPFHLIHLVNHMYLSEVADGEGNWKWELFQDLLPMEILPRIAATMRPLPSASKDCVGGKLAVRRCNNRVADYLARLASPLDFTTCVLETPPAGTVNLLQADGYG
ncbi:hypothetical protein V6N13_060197 [Hibiscus sabdariffa]